MVNHFELYNKEPNRMYLRKNFVFNRAARSKILAFPFEPTLVHSAFTLLDTDSDKLAQNPIGIYIGVCLYSERLRIIFYS